MSANRAYADVLIEAPSEQWARMIESHLQTSLADEGYAQLAAPGEPAPNSAPSVPRVFRCSVESSMLSEEACETVWSLRSKTSMKPASRRTARVRPLR